MTRRRRSRPAGRRDIVLSPMLRDSMLRMGVRDAFFWGWWLARLRRVRGQTTEAQAAALGLTLDALAYLGLCRAPLPERRVEDVQVVAKAVGLDPEALDKLLREAEGVGEEMP
jgi:hypothetical protein